ncbi:Bromodomain-containing factor 2 domain protein [Saccharomyces cerevisiae]|nr:Bromodomain-containing factor 2 domain protein [Saccharomyces cerevisiae]
MKHSVDDLKKSITDKINELSDLEMNGMIRIIKNSLPADEILTSNEDEIEIDLDILDEATIARIYERYFEKKNNNNSKRKLSGNYSTAPTNKKKKTLKFLEKDEIINNNNYSDSEEDSSDSSDSDSD